MLLGIIWHQHVRNDEVRRSTKQPYLSAIVQSGHLSLFRHIARMPDETDAKQILRNHSVVSIRPVEPGTPAYKWVCLIPVDGPSNSLLHIDIIATSINTHQSHRLAFCNAHSHNTRLQETLQHLNVTHIHTTGTSSYYMHENHSAGSEIQWPQYGRRSWLGSEPSTLEIDVYVWRYALLVVLARNDDDDDDPVWMLLKCPLIRVHSSYWICWNPRSNKFHCTKHIWV